MEILISTEGRIDEPGSWTAVFEVWSRSKSGNMVGRGQPLKLVVFPVLWKGISRTTFRNSHDDLSSTLSSAGCHL